MGAVRIELGIQQDNEKEFTVDYSAPFVNVSWLESDPFYFRLNIDTRLNDITPKSKRPVIATVGTTYLDYGEKKLDKEGIVGSIWYTDKNKPNGEYYGCLYELGQNNDPEFFSLDEVCDDEAVDLLRNLRKSKEDAYNEADITDDDVVRYFTWYAINGKNIESSEE